MPQWHDPTHCFSVDEIVLDHRRAISDGHCQFRRQLLDESNVCFRFFSFKTSLSAPPSKAAIKPLNRAKQK
jgi:hypothetical protein